MYSKTQLAFKYLEYFITAGNGKGHGMHSPFVFDFITKVMNDRKQYDEYSMVEKIRQQLLADGRILTVEDFGAGSAISKTKQRTVSSVAKNAAKSKKYGQLLYRIIKYYSPQTIIELGTSLGITTSYLSLANPSARLITMEGAGAIANVAKQNFAKLGLRNIELVAGNFDNTLQGSLEKTTSVDFAFIDGNHRRLPTERYFKMLLGKTHKDSVLIFDDIHWSGEMEEAWETVKARPEVRCTIDLFFIGLVFFRQEFREKQHFTIRF